jgi:hypothetical protein
MNTREELRAGLVAMAENANLQEGTRYQLNAVTAARLLAQVDGLDDELMAAMAISEVAEAPGVEIFLEMLDEHVIDDSQSLNALISDFLIHTAAEH